MLNVFAAGTDVTLAVPLTDTSGNVLAVDTVSYRLLDHRGNELLAETSLDDFIPGSETADILIPALLNQLAPGIGRALRAIELACVIDTNSVTLNAVYAVSVPDPLVPGINSFATYNTLQFVGLDIPNLDGWYGASQLARTAALIEARERISRLSFGFLECASIDQLTPDRFMSLPERFVSALIKAQLVEADAILGGVTIETKRRDGLLADDIGESRQVYRPSSPLQLPVCRRALGYLSLYVSFAKRIGRA